MARQTRVDDGEGLYSVTDGAASGRWLFNYRPIVVITVVRGNLSLGASRTHFGGYCRNRPPRAANENVRMYQRTSPA